MSGTDIGQHIEIGSDHLPERSHLAGLIDTGLDHSEILTAWIEPKKCHGHTDEVIPVARSRVACVAEEAAEYFFGRSLAATAGHRDDWLGELPADSGGDHTEGRKAVRDLELRQRELLGLFDQRRDCPTLRGLLDEVVPVTRATTEGDEALPRLYLTGVKAETVDRCGRFADPRSPRPCG